MRLCIFCLVGFISFSSYLNRLKASFSRMNEWILVMNENLHGLVESIIFFVNQGGFLKS